MSSIKASTGLSRKWNPKEAGREVTRDAVDRLGEKPKFVILACTYEYQKEKGYEKLLEGVWEILPEGTELIGGTISGFMIPRGCYSRGVAMLAVTGDMDVASAHYEDTKWRPEKAGKKAGKKILKKLDGSKYRNGFFVDFTSGPYLVNIPIIGKRKVVESKLVGWGVSLFLPIMGWFGFGNGREERVRESLTKVLHDYKGVGFSTWDDNRFLYHRVFHGKKVFMNTIAVLGMKSDFDSYVNAGFGFKKTEKSFMVTKTDRSKRIIEKINGKPAKQEYLRILDWKPEYIDENHVSRTEFVLPSFEKDGALYPEVTSLFYGDYIVLGRRLDDPRMTVLTISGKSLINAVDDSMENFEGKPIFALMPDCGARQQALGDKIFKAKEKIDNYMKGAPYLDLFCAGEATYTPEQGSRHKHESFNIGIVKKDKKNSLYNDGL